MHRNVKLLIKCAMTAAMCAVFLTACANTEETAQPAEESVAETASEEAAEDEYEAVEGSAAGAAEEETAAGEADGISDDMTVRDIPEDGTPENAAEVTDPDDVPGRLDQSYLVYANAVMRADGEGESISEDKLTLSTYWDGDEEEAAANEERSILWASDYGTVTVRELNATSTSAVNFERLSGLNGLSEVNTDIASEWGVNAVLLATDGGTVTVGNDEDDTSSFYANGAGAIGVYAGGTGDRAATGEAPAPMSIADIRNADFIMDGWKNHVACAAYGGYVSLQKVNATTGILGSYSVGDSPALYAGYGDGFVDVTGLNVFTYGSDSHGAYVSGDGTVKIRDSALTSAMGSGLVMNSGGVLNVKRTAVSGQTGLTVRGDVKRGYDSVFENVIFTAVRDLNGYVYGDKAKEAAEAWGKASGSIELAGNIMGDPEMTFGGLCEEYGLSEEESAAFIEELSEISGIPYSSRTFLRNSVMDNTFYDYGTGRYLTGTDYTEIPYLTVGAASGGYVSSVLAFDSADIDLIFAGCSFINTNTDDYDYLIASEAGSAPELLFKDCDASGIIWNEGEVTRTVDGKKKDLSSTLFVTFSDSAFTGSFADGPNGLWDIYIPVEEDLSAETEESDDAGEAGMTEGSNENGDEETGNRDGADEENDEAEEYEPQYITVLNGNYYDAEGNFGIAASFIGESVWTVTHDSYLGELILGTAAQIAAPDGYSLSMTVDGEETDIVPGTYTGEIILSLIPEEED